MKRGWRVMKRGWRVIERGRRVIERGWRVIERGWDVRSSWKEPFACLDRPTPALASNALDQIVAIDDAMPDELDDAILRHRIKFESVGHANTDETR
jgi:hypothetical protein